MAASYLHIYLKPKNGVDTEQVKEQMNLALDWYRYSSDCWIVRTSSDIDKWQTRLKPLVDDNSGGLLIMEVKVDHHYRGWMVEKFWDWLRESQD